MRDPFGRGEGWRRGGQILPPRGRRGAADHDLTDVTDGDPAGDPPGDLTGDHTGDLTGGLTHRDAVLDPDAASRHDPLLEPDAALVRPYLVTGGRTRPSSGGLPIEALVRALPAQGGGRQPSAAPEKRLIVELTSGQYLSIAEVSAHTRLPVGVVRVLVGDLEEEGLVRVDGLPSHTDPAASPAATLSILESVLNGISAL